MLSLLQTRLLQALQHHNFSTEAFNTNVRYSELEQVNIAQVAHALPLKRFGKATPIVYVCAIAHCLVTKTQPVTTIAAKLVASLRQGDSSHPEGLPQGVTVQATAAGIIQFEIGDRAIAAWLDQLITEPPQLSLLVEPMAEAERQVMLQASAVFEVQYAHARCCSLLQLAQRESLSKLERLEESPLHWRFTNRPALPWLTATDQLCLNHPADRALLSQLFAALDCLFDPSPRQTQQVLLRSAQAVAQALQTFHRAHPLGDRAEAQPSLLLARLGLLMATQRVLWLLLLHGLALCPVVQL